MDNNNIWFKPKPTHIDEYFEDFLGYLKSSNSGTVRNRVVEPFYLDGNEYLHCYEPETGDTKLFRISRADKVVMLEEPWAFRSKHKKLNVDPFHMTGYAKINVKLRLKVQAKNAIEEYYPGISQYISPYNSDTWTLDTFTYNLAPPHDLLPEPGALRGDSGGQGSERVRQRLRQQIPAHRIDIGGAFGTNAPPMSLAWVAPSDSRGAVDSQRLIFPNL